jgi:HAD superfamily hydrolase (TIGR01490 family)
MKKIAVFDFDGTMIKQDSMVLFFFAYFDFKIRYLPVFFKILFGAVKYMLRLESQLSFKQKYINTAIKYAKKNGSHQLAKDFSDLLLRKVSAQALEWIKKLRSQGYELVLLSASIDIYLEKVYKELGFAHLICTNVYEEDGDYLIKKNCYGPHKVEMLRDYYQGDKIDWESSYCFTDGSSDKGLLDLFGHPYIINNKRFYRKNPKFRFQKWH